MNKNQKIIIVIGLVLILLSGLFPAYEGEFRKDDDYLKQYLGYYFIFSPPTVKELKDAYGDKYLYYFIQFDTDIVLSRFILQLVTILFLMIGLFYLFAEPKYDIKFPTNKIIFMWGFVISFLKKNYWKVLGGVVAILLIVINGNFVKKIYIQEGIDVGKEQINEYIISWKDKANECQLELNKVREKKEKELDECKQDIDAMKKEIDRLKIEIKDGKNRRQINYKLSI